MHDEEPNVDAWLDRLIEELLRLDAARQEEIRGCTDEEVQRVLAECPFGSPPLEYVRFMRKCGRNTGNLFRGSDFHYPDFLGLRNYAAECKREEDANVPLGRRFFFGHHQGYMLYYFKPEDGRVWLYTLGGTEEEIAAASFPKLVADNLAIPERHWERFRERDGKNRSS